MLAEQAANVAATTASMVLVPKDDPLGKILFVCIVLIIGLACFISLITVLSALFPRARDRFKSTLTSRPWICLAVGIVGYAGLGAWSGYLFSTAWVVRLLETEILYDRLVGGSVVLAVLLTITFIGATGAVGVTADKLAAWHGREVSPIKLTMWTTAALVLACWFPLMGWLVLWPALLLLSFGAAIIGLIGRILGRG